MNDTTNHYNARKQDGSAPSSLRDLMSELSDLADALAEHQYQRGFLQVVTLKDCIRYYKEEAGKIRSVAVAGFVLSVKKNPDPRNENDNFIVVQGLVDGQNKPITSNGESVSRIMHTRTIDDALIKVLNGKESGIFRV